jgi:hypothetical protein
MTKTDWMLSNEWITSARVSLDELEKEVKRLREVISRATNTLLSNPPEELFELTSPTLTQDIGDLIGFYTQAMGHAIGILEGTE